MIFGYLRAYFFQNLAFIFDINCDFFSAKQHKYLDVKTS